MAVHQSILYSRYRGFRLGVEVGVVFLKFARQNLKPMPGSSLGINPSKFYR